MRGGGSCCSRCDISRFYGGIKDGKYGSQISGVGEDGDRAG